MFLALPLRAETVTVFAAASLRDALTEITTDWQAQTGHRVRVSSAGSSALARQIQAGAPADL
ncbi:MAG: substrate-binding domain-containing protein, partial [Paracoccaceae bacterium]